MPELDVHPTALRELARQAQHHAQELGQILPALDLHSAVLGDFEEATSLVGALNDQTKEVHERLAKTSLALSSLATAAAQAADLAGKSDADVAAGLKKVNQAVDAAKVQIRTRPTA